MSLDWRVVVIKSWPGVLTRARKYSRFNTTWSATLTLLGKELRQLRAKDVLLQMAVRDRDIRLDGAVRANARPASHPGVILTFESKHGPLSYPCDTFTEWQANVRAIALALEALRKIDRYGVTKRGEQYTGWGQLPPVGGTTTTMSPRIAAEILVDVEQLSDDPECGAEILLLDYGAVEATYRNAAKNAHPDRHSGDTERFQLLGRAKAVLDAHHSSSAV